MLVHASSAWLVPVRALVERRDALVLTMRDAGVLAPQRPAAFIAHEPAQLHRLTTETGRLIEATANQQFLTRAGWKPLIDLEHTDRVAVIAEYPDLFGRGDTDSDLLKVLAYLTANGTSGDGTTAVMPDGAVRRDFCEAVAAKGDRFLELTEDDGTRLRICGQAGSRSKILSYLHLVGVHGVCGADRVIPDFIFGLRRDKLRLFLSRVLSCDASVETAGQIRYRAPSMRTAKQVQHLLGRFGIVATLGDIKRDVDGVDLWIEGKSDVVRFIDQIGFVGEKAAQAEFLRASLYDVRDEVAHLDRLGPILFDRVAGVGLAGEAEVYDLVIAGSRNFIANDFVVRSGSSN